MPIGVPASGKSTLTQKLGEEFAIPIVSSDEIREEIYGDASKQGNPAKVFSLVHARAAKWLDEVGICILDATNLNFRFRNAAYEELEPNIIIHLVMDISLEECKRRNNERERVVPEYVIDRMYEQFKQRTWEMDKELYNVLTFYCKE